MAKKEIRVITASEDIATIIDQGAEVDNELKNLTYKDKGFKKKITEVAENLIEKDEQSIRLEGNVSKAVVTASEKYSFALGSDKESVVIEAVDNRLLGDVVNKSQTLNVPKDKLQEAAEILHQAGIPATISTSYSVDGKAYREFSDEGSPEVAAAKAALDSCVSKSITFRVTYER